MKSYGSIGDPVAEYVCAKVVEPPVIDGNIEKACWKQAIWTPSFRDMVTFAPATLETFGALLWDEHALYVAFDIREPDIRGTLTERDSFIWLENDIELFIGGEDCYYEFEMNALGTIYEAFYVWKDAYTAGSHFAQSPQFDLTRTGVDILGGFQDAFDHPRGARWAFLNFDFPGLRSAVRLSGTLNQSQDTDTGWTAELALPWDGMRQVVGEIATSPKAGDVLRLNLFRFQTIEHNGRTITPSAGWSWSRHGAYDSHIPECFGRVTLAE